MSEYCCLKEDDPELQRAMDELPDGEDWQYMLTSSEGDGWQHNFKGEGNRYRKIPAPPSWKPDESEVLP